MYIILSRRKKMSIFITQRCSVTQLNPTKNGARSWMLAIEIKRVRKKKKHISTIRTNGAIIRSANSYNNTELITVH